MSCKKCQASHNSGANNRRIRANKAGCLDQCEKGPTVVVYPEAVWYGRVTEADVNEIIEQHIIGGTPVARLLMPEGEAAQKPR